jgi:hypothetical protein
MHRLPFDQPGRFWRGNLHTHSTLSDGRLPAEEVCRRYAQAGYDFMSLTEHFLPQYGFPIADTRPMRTQNFTTVIGAELHAGQTELGGMWHVLAVGLPFDFAPPAENETGPEIAARARATGAFVAAAHPQWYTLTEQDILSLGEIDAIEVYNGVADDGNDRADSWHITDILLGRGQRYLTYAADDYHHIETHHDFARGWVWVKAEALDPDGIMAALKAGSFYSSTGPMIHDVQVEPGKQVTVRCSPAERILVNGSGPGTVMQAGRGLTEVTLDIAKLTSAYLRVTVRDANGGRAWTNPFWFDGQ